MVHNKRGECQSEAELHERSEQEAFVIEELKDLSSELDRQKSEENFRVLLRLRQIVEIDLDGTNFLTRSSLNKMCETLRKPLQAQVIELSYSQLFDMGKFERDLMDDSLLNIPLNWTKLMNGEAVEEDFEITEHRYSFLISQGHSKEALKVANIVGCPDLMFRDLRNIFQPGSEEHLDAISAAIEVLLTKENGMNLKVYEALDFLIPNSSEHRKKHTFDLLYSCFYKDPRLFIDLLIRFGDIDDYCKVISYITKQIEYQIWRGDSPEVLEMVRKLIFDMLPRHEDIRSNLFRLGLLVFEATSYDFVDEMVSLCSTADEVIKVILSLGCSPQVPSSNALPVVERIIDILKAKYPDLIGQVIKVILDKMNALAFFDLICLHGDHQDGVKLIGQIRANSGQVPKERVYEMVSQVTKNMLPRLPDLRQELLAIHLSVLAKDPDNCKINDAFSLCDPSSSDDARKVVTLIEEKTAFGNNSWCTDRELKRIMNEVCLKFRESWPALLPNALKIILEQFETDSTWAYHLFQFGSGNDLKKACTALSSYITNKGAENLLSVIKHLISQATTRWPEALKEVTCVLPLFFERAKLTAENYRSLFNYPFWTENRECFMQCLKSQWKILKNLPSKEWIPLAEALTTIFRGNVHHVPNVRALFTGMVGKIDQRVDRESHVQATWIRSADLVGRCKSAKYQSDPPRCDGCLQLVTFLRSENEQLNITVNQGFRRCITRLLMEMVTKDPAKPNERTPLHDALKVRFTELNATENRSRFRNARSCGCVLVTKLSISGASPKEKIARYKSR